MVVGVSAIGLCDDNFGIEQNTNMKISMGYSDLEHMMLNAIVMECRSCISSEGHDCYPHGLTACPFSEVRKTIGLHDIDGF